MGTSEEGEAVSPEFGGPTLRVLQLNIGSLFEPGWVERRHEIVAWLDQLAPDVICLQEVVADGTGANTASWLAAQSAPSQWHSCFGGFAVPERLGYQAALRLGSAVLSRWPIVERTLQRLPGPEADIANELLHARTAGLDLFSVHLAAPPEQSALRQRQVLAVEDLVRRHSHTGNIGEPFGPPRETMPPIVAGDFNAEPESDEIRFLCGLATVEGRGTFYQDAWRAAGEGPGYTQDWRSNPLASALNVPRKRIDYVFVGDPFRRQGSAGRVVGAAIALDRPLTGVLASDHFGLVVDVLWPQRPPCRAPGSQ